MLRMKALVRTRCRGCGPLMRTDRDDIVALHGPGYELVDKLSRCRMVECTGSTLYLATRIHGGQWTTLLARSEADRGVRGAAARQDGVMLTVGPMS